MIWIIVIVVGVLVFSTLKGFSKDLKKVQDIPFRFGFKHFINKLNECFFNNEASIVTINEMEFHLIPKYPFNQAYPFFIKMKYTGYHLRVMVIDTLYDNEKLDFEATFKTDKILDCAKQEEIVEDFVKIYKENSKLPYI